jgi:NTP pyrophosphatase (non-canonical NTP hydrolase)
MPVPDVSPHPLLRQRLSRGGGESCSPEIDIIVLKDLSMTSRLLGCLLVTLLCESLTQRLLAADAPVSVKSKVAAVEIGSKGLKYTVFEPVLQSDNSVTVTAKTLVDLKSDNTKIAGAQNFGIVEQKFSVASLTVIALEVEKILNDEEINKDIPKENRSVVISSGVVLKARELDKLDELESLEKVITNGTGRAPTRITVSEEVRLQLDRMPYVSAAIGVDPKSTLLVDIGSGNTKYGLYVNNKAVVFELSQSLSGKTLEPFVALGVDKPGPIDQARHQQLIGDLSSQVAEQVKAQMATLNLPAASLPKVVVVNGGAFWGMMTTVQYSDIQQDNSAESLVPVKATTPATFEAWVLGRVADAPAGWDAAVTALPKKFEASRKAIKSNAERSVAAGIIQGLLNGFALVKNGEEFQWAEAGAPPVKVYWVDNGHLTWINQFAYEQATGKKVDDKQGGTPDDNGARVVSPSIPVSSLDSKAIEDRLKSIQTEVGDLKRDVSTLAGIFDVKKLDALEQEMKDLTIKLAELKLPDLKALPTKEFLDGLAKKAELETTTKKLGDVELKLGDIDNKLVTVDKSLTSLSGKIDGNTSQLLKNTTELTSTSTQLASLATVVTRMEEQVKVNTERVDANTAALRSQELAFKSQAEEFKKQGEEFKKLSVLIQSLSPSDVASRPDSSKFPVSPSLVDVVSELRGLKGEVAKIAAGTATTPSGNTTPNGSSSSSAAQQTWNSEIQTSTAATCCTAPTACYTCVTPETFYWSCRICRRCCRW